MQAIPSVSVTKAIAHWPRSLGNIIVLAGLLTACSPQSRPEDRIDVKLYQNWQLQPGDVLGGNAVIGGLGDISIALNGKPVYAPFNGRVQQDSKNCLIFSAPDVPAYLFRLCGVNAPHLGRRNQGELLGSAATLNVATLRKQPNGSWAIVEPSKPTIERFLTKL